VGDRSRRARPAAGHRPSRRRRARAENSLAAFAAARAAGADAIETDLRLTADGVAVCAHDDAVAGADGARIMIADASLAALRRAAPAIAIFNDAASPGLAAYLDIKETAPQRVVALLGTLAVERCGADWIVGVASTALAGALAQHFPALRQVGLMLDRREIAAFARARPGGGCGCMSRARRRR